MKTLPDIRPIPSELSDRTVTLNLTLHGPERVSLRSCEVMGRGFRNRISFSENKMIEEVLVARLANAIKSCLRDLPDRAQVLALPDFLMELPGLALSGMHLLIMEAKQGVRNAILRFTEFLGAVNNAFSADIGFHEPYSTYTERLAINVLADVCLPILNLCRSFESLDEQDDRCKTRSLADRAREFEFQTELLKRFIFNAGIGHASAGAAYLDEATAPAARRLTRHG